MQDLSPTAKQYIVKTLFERWAKPWGGINSKTAWIKLAASVIRLTPHHPRTAVADADAVEIIERLAREAAGG